MLAAGSQPRSGPPPRRGSGLRPAPLARGGSLLILLLLLGGCFALWIGVPAAGLWLSSKLTDSFGWHMPLALLIVVPGMLAMAAALAWLNDLYLRVTGGRIVGSPQAPVRRRGPLEPLLVASLVVAACAFAFWFFVLAENPALTP